MRARIIGKKGGFDPQHKIKNWYKVLLLSELRNALNSDDKEKMMQAAELSRSSAFEVSMYFYFSPPDSWPKKRRKQAIEGKLRHTQKPDCDNLEKFLIDCASGILFPDDRMIVAQCSCKAYAESPRTVIEVRGVSSVF